MTHSGLPPTTHDLAKPHVSPRPVPLLRRPHLSVDQARAAIAAALKPLIDRDRGGACRRRRWAGCWPRRDLADRCAGARQLGHGRVCLPPARVAQDADSACASVPGDAGTPWAGHAAARRVPAHHDRCGDARGAGHRGAAGAVPRSRGTVHAAGPSGRREAAARTDASGERTWPRPPGSRAPAACCAGRPGADRPRWASTELTVCAACGWRCSPPATSCASPGQPLDPRLHLRQQPLQPVGRAAAPGL
jgi:hypothetical protein